jgi:hypothetical protein
MNLARDRSFDRDLAPHRRDVELRNEKRTTLPWAHVEEACVGAAAALGLREALAPAVNARPLHHHQERALYRRRRGDEVR